jgi:thiamine kinase-like enzyme
MLDFEIKQSVIACLQNIPETAALDFNELVICSLEGWTNAVYQISFGETRFILRIPRPFSDQFINRFVERANYQLAQSIGMTPPFVFFDDQTGIMLRSYVEGCIPSKENKGLNSRNVSRMAQMLRKLHTSQLAFANYVDNFEVIDHYCYLIQQYGGALNRRYQVIIQSMKIVWSILSKFPAINVPCHNDAHHCNFIETAQGEVQLFDWEYAGLSNPFFDLVYLLVYANLSELEEIEVLKNYFGVDELTEADAFELAQVAVFKPYSKFIFAALIRFYLTVQNYPIPLKDLEAMEETSLADTERLLNTDSYKAAVGYLSKASFN